MMEDISSNLTIKEDAIIYELPETADVSRSEFNDAQSLTGNVFLPCVEYRKNGKRRLMYLCRDWKSINDFVGASETEALTMVNVLFQTAEIIAEAGASLSSRVFVDSSFIYWRCGEDHCSFMLLPPLRNETKTEPFDLEFVRLLTKMLTEWKIFSGFRSYIRLLGATACSLGETFDLLKKYSANPSEALRMAKLSAAEKHRPAPEQKDEWHDCTVAQTVEDEQKESSVYSDEQSRTRRFSNIGDTVMAEDAPEVTGAEDDRVPVPAEKKAFPGNGITNHSSETIMDTQMFFDGKSEESEVPPSERQIPPRYRLQSVNPRNRISFAVPVGGMILGRSSEVDNVSAAFLSKFVYIGGKHCRLFFENGTLFAEDMSSRNGTFINGEKIMPGKPKKLSAGDILRLANIDLELVRG